MRAHERQHNLNLFFPPAENLKADRSAPHTGVYESSGVYQHLRADFRRSWCTDEVIQAVSFHLAAVGCVLAGGEQSVQIKLTSDE